MHASTMLISLLLLPSAAAAPGASPAGTINVRAWVDGRSRLVIDDDTATWQHFDFAAPGRLDCNTGAPIEATFLDGVSWLPDWPDVPDCENRFCGGCSSSTYTGLVTALPDADVSLALIPIDVRGTAALVELPSAGNGWRAVIELDDNPIGGAAWYEVELVVGPAPATFCNGTDGALAACPCSNPGDADTGCDNVQGTGGVRLSVAGFDPLAGRASLVGTGFPVSSRPTVIAIRSSALLSAPLALGDGLVCIASPVARTSTATAAELGTSVHSIVHAGGSETLHYQLWYRSQPAAFCTPAGFNTSNGLTLEW